MSEITKKTRAGLMQLPIRWRLTLVSLSLLVFLVSCFGLIILLTAEQALFTNSAMALHNEARLAVTGLKDHPLSLVPSTAQPHASNGNQPGSNQPGTNSASGNQSSNNQSGTGEPLSVQLQILVNRLAGASANAEVLSLNGAAVITKTNAPLAPPSVILSARQVRQQIENNQSNTAYVLATDTQRTRQQVVLIPLYQDRTAIGILQISTPTTSVDTFITTLRLILLIGIIGAIGMGIALTFPLISVTLRPLVAMERATRDIAGGNLSRRLEIYGTDDEISRLSLSFNRMVAQLETSIERQKQFVADVSHELRTPLTALQGSLEVLLMGINKGDAVATRRLIQGMYTEINRMQRLIENLLTLSRLDEGKLIAHNKDFALRTVLDATYDHAQQLAQGQEITYHIAPGNLAVHADQDHLQRVMINLVDNALKFTARDGHIQIDAKQGRAGQVIITVQDDGVGIAQEALPHIFDRFYRIDASRSRQTAHVGGHGLGLAIAQELIEAQDGEITITSTPDVGTTVTLQLNGAASSEGISGQLARPAAR